MKHLKSRTFRMIRLEPVVQRCSVKKVFLEVLQNSQENVAVCVLTKKSESQIRVQGNTKERHLTLLKNTLQTERRSDREKPKQ